MLEPNRILTWATWLTSPFLSNLVSQDSQDDDAMSTIPDIHGPPGRLSSFGSSTEIQIWISGSLFEFSANRHTRYS